MVNDQHKRKFVVIPLSLLYIDRKRYDALHSETQTKITSYREFPNGIYRVHFLSKPIGENKAAASNEETRSHLLWIQLITLEGEKHVKYCCDCKYFLYRQLIPGRRAFGMQDLGKDLCCIFDPQQFHRHKKLYNIDKHCFIALRELFKEQVPIAKIQ